MKALAPLRIRDLSKKEVRDRFGGDIDAFLGHFMTEYNNSFNTVYESNGRTQTEPGKRRSIEDIYRVLVYYYPKASLSNTYKRLIKLMQENKIGSAICDEIHKRVYRNLRSNESISFFNGSLTDEYGVDFEILGIKNIDINLNNSKVGWGHNYNESNIKFVEL